MHWLIGRGAQNSFPVGGRYAAFTWNFWFLDNPDQWMISPEVTVSRGDTLTFWVSANMVMNYNDHLDIMVSQSGTDDYSFTDVICSIEFNSMELYPWKKYKLDISK